VRLLVYVIVSKDYHKENIIKHNELIRGFISKIISTGTPLGFFSSSRDSKSETSFDTFSSDNFSSLGQVSSFKTSMIFVISRSIVRWKHLFFAILLDFLDKFPFLLTLQASSATSFDLLMFPSDSSSANI
jgi:hypothetical protein